MYWLDKSEKRIIKKGLEKGVHYKIRNDRGTFVGWGNLKTLKRLNNLEVKE